MSQCTVLQQSFDNTVSGVSGGSFFRTTKKRDQITGFYLGDLVRVQDAVQSVIQQTKDSSK
jgi:hypothetical protein